MPGVAAWSFPSGYEPAMIRKHWSDWRGNYLKQPGGAIIGVSSVQRSLRWYQALVGQPATLPAHDYFGQILDSNGTVLLWLHEWGHETRGNGLLFRPCGRGALGCFGCERFGICSGITRWIATHIKQE